MQSDRCGSATSFANQRVPWRSPVGIAIIAKANVRLVQASVSHERG